MLAAPGTLRAGVLRNNFAETICNCVSQSHHNIQASVLQHHVLHEPANINNARYVDLSYGRKAFANTGARAKRTVSQVDAAHIFNSSQAGVNSNN